jgi:TIGR00251 family protein
MSVIIEIKVVPVSGMQKCILDKSGAIKCFIKSPPEDGKANKELVKMLAYKFGVVMADVTIVSGLTSRKKKIKIEGNLEMSDVYRILGLAVQNAVF